MKKEMNRREAIKELAGFGSVFLLGKLGNVFPELRLVREWKPPEGERIYTRELSGNRLDMAFNNALSSESSQPAIDYLESNGYKLDPSTISAHEATWRTNDHKQFRRANLIQASYSNGPALAHLIIAQKDDQFRVGLGIMNSRSNNGRVVQVYEVAGSTLKKGIQLHRLSSGDLRAIGANGKKMTIPYTKWASPASSSKCNTCKDVCNVLHSLGCGLGGIYACYLTCLMTGPACPIVCPAVFLVVCIVSNYTNCKWICNDVLEYC